MLCDLVIASTRVVRPLQNHNIKSKSVSCPDILRHVYETYRVKSHQKFLLKVIYCFNASRSILNFNNLFCVLVWLNRQALVINTIVCVGCKTAYVLKIFLQHLKTISLSDCHDQQKFCETYYSLNLSRKRRNKTTKVQNCRNLAK